MEHELLSLSQHLSSAPVFSGARVARSFLCNVFVFTFILSDIPVQFTPLLSSNSSSQVNTEMYI